MACYMSANFMVLPCDPSNPICSHGSCYYARKVPEFMNQEPKVVARFVAECLHKHWQSVDDPVPYGDVHDTFSSDYSPSALDSNSWTQSESSVLQSLSHDDSVSSIVAHGAEVGSSRAPHFDGANR
jgi:hypothetical protein